MSSSPSAPQPVDPWTQAAAQYGLSTGTAQYNAGLNRTNQVNPLGSSSWTSTGGGSPSGGGSSMPAPTDPYSSFGGFGGFGGYGGFGLGGGGMPTSGLPTSSGGSSAPTYTQTTQLTPWAQDALQKPIDTSGIAGMPGGPSTTQDLQSTQDALYQKQMQYLAPEQKLSSEQMDSKLANMGATIGSPAWNNEQDRLARQQQSQTSDARTQAITGAGAEQSRLFGLGSQGLQNQIAVRNAPISEYNSLTGAPGANATALTPDISGAFGQQYTGELNSANAQNASNNQTQSSLGTLAMMAAMYFSDRRLKEDIKQVGKTDDGLPVYTYRFKGDQRVQMGVMAQDVEKEKPEAVFSLGGRDGPKMVNYGAIS